MNIQSAQMLQDSLQNLGNTFRNQRQQEIEAAYRNSQLDLERERNGTDKALREAQLQHQITMDNANNRRANANEARLNAAEKRYGVQKAFQDMQSARENITKGLQGMSLDKTLSPDEKTAYLQQSIDGLDDTIKSGILQNPQIKSLYDGSGDWDAVAASVQKAGKAPPLNEREITIKHPAIGDKDAVPPVHHWFGPDEPGKPAVPGTPEWDEKIIQRVPVGQPMPTNAPFAMPPFTPDTNAPATVPPVTGLAPSMGSTALNTNGIPTGKPDPQDVQWLSQNPNPRRIATFEGKYGKGSASALLNPPTQQ